MDVFIPSNGVSELFSVRHGADDNYNRSAS